MILDNTLNTIRMKGSSTLETYNLKNKVALITGAGKGIGKAIAFNLAKMDVKLVLNSIDSENLTAVTGKINALGGEAISVQGDISQLNCVENVVQTGISHYGRIDILVNNAGLGGEGKRIVDLTYEEWDRIMQVNLWGTFMLCKEAVPYMIKQRSGKIVNMSSIYGITGIAGSVPYSSAKAGIIGLTKALAKEVAEYNINVNVVAPGLIDTDMSRKRGTGKSGVLWPRIGQPDDIASLIRYLVSDLSEFITGQVISPNGGELI